MTYTANPKITILVPTTIAWSGNMGPLTSEQELAFIESQSGGPHYIPQDMADECIARYGRVPNNFRVGKLRIYKRKTPRSERPQGGAQWKREQKRRCL